MGFLSNIFGGIWDALDSIWEGITDLVENVWEIAWDNILNPVLEPLFGLIGITDETVILVEVVTQPLFDLDSRFVTSIDKAILTSVSKHTESYPLIKLAVLDNTVTALRRYHDYGELGESRVEPATTSDGYIFGKPTIKQTYADSNLSALDTVLISLHSGATAVTTTFINFGSLRIGEGSTDLYRHSSWWFMQNNEATWNQTAKTWDETNYNVDQYIPNSYTENTYWESIVSATSYYEASPEAMADTVAAAWEASSGDYTNAVVSSVEWPYLASNDKAAIHINYDDLGSPTSTTIVVDRYSCEGTPPAGATVYCGYTPNDAYIFDTTTLVSTTWTYVNTTAAYGGLNINFTDGTYNRVIWIPYPAEGVYYAVEYTVTDGVDAGIDFVWIYDAQSDVYPSLSQILGGVVTESWDFVPVVPLRKDFTYIDDDTGSQEYLTSRALLNKLNLDINILIEGVKTNTEDINVTDAFIAFGTNIYSTNQADNKYLWGFFTAMSTQTIVDKAQYDAEVADTAVTDAPFNAFGITEQNYNVLFEFNYIDIEDLAGNVGPVNWVNKTINYTGTTTKNHRDDTIVMTMQYSDTNYYRMTIKGLAMVHAVTSTLNTVRLKAIALVDPLSTTDEDKRARQNFCLPLSYAVLRYCGNTSDQEEIVYRAANLVIYAEDIQYLEWYETAAFARFLEIAYYIYVIFTLGKGATEGKLLELGEQVLKTIAIQLALNLVYKLTDDPAIRLLATLIAAAATTKVNGGNPFDLMDVKVALSNVKAIGDTYLSVKSEDLQAEMEVFKLKREEYQSELDRIDELLNQPSDIALSLVSIKQSLILNNETPTEFYDRTLDTNPGIKTIGTIETFYDRMLRLPELDPKFDTSDITTTPDTVIS